LGRHLWSVDLVRPMIIEIQSKYSNRSVIFIIIITWITVTSEILFVIFFIFCLFFTVARKVFFAILEKTQIFRQLNYWTWKCGKKIIVIKEIFTQTSAAIFFEYFSLFKVFRKTWVNFSQMQSFISFISDDARRFCYPNTSSSEIKIWRKNNCWKTCFYCRDQDCCRDETQK
jgi:hypothetical protein